MAIMGERMESIIQFPYQLPPVEELFTPAMYNNIKRSYLRELLGSHENIAAIVENSAVKDKSIPVVLDGGVIGIRLPVNPVLGIALIDSHDAALAHAGNAVKTGIDRACDAEGIDRTAVAFDIVSGFCRDDRTMMGFIVSKKDSPPEVK